MTTTSYDMSLVVMTKSNSNKKRGQRRAAHLRTQANLTRSQQTKINTFNKKRQRVKEKLRPTHTQLKEATLQDSNKSQSRRTEAASIQAEALDVYTAGQDEERIVREIVSQWKDGGHGYVPEVKPDDVIRLTGENSNSLSLFAPHQWKVKKMCNLNNKHQSDGTMLVETGTNWDETPAGKSQAIYLLDHSAVELKLLIIKTTSQLVAHSMEVQQWQPSVACQALCSTLAKTPLAWADGPGS